MSALSDLDNAWFMPVKKQHRTANALVASALHLPDDFAHALVAAIVTDNWGLHTQCGWTFCRAPLHPGPCKGWKHKLRQVAPGVYDALEKVRIQKLEEKRKAKIKQLTDAGLPVPKKLLQKTQPLPLPQPAPGDTSKPDQPPLSQATEDKLKKVSQKVKDVNEQAKKAAAAKKAAPAKKEPEAPKAPEPEAPKINEKANAAANVAFAPQHYTKDERIDAYIDLDKADIESLSPDDLDTVVTDLLTLDADQSLSPGQRAKVDQLLAKFKDTLSQSDNKPDLPEAAPEPSAVAKSDLHAKPPSSVDPNKVGDLDAPNQAALDEIADVIKSPYKYSVNEQIGAAAALSKKDFDALPIAKQKQVANLLKLHASSASSTEAQRMLAISTAKSLGSPNTLGSPNQVAAVKAVLPSSGLSPVDRLDTYAKLTKDDFEGLSAGQQVSLKNDLKNIAKDGGTAEKQYVKEIAKQLAGKGTANKPADLGVKVKEDALGDLMEKVGPDLLSHKQQNVVDFFAPHSMATDWNKWTSVTVLDKDEFNALPDDTKQKVLELVEQVATGKGNPKYFDVGDQFSAVTKYSDLTGNPLPGTGKKSGKDAMTEAAPVDITHAPDIVDTFTHWQEKKKNIGAAPSNPNTVAAKLHQVVANGTVADRLNTYEGYTPTGSVGFGKLQPALQEAIVADLDNIVAGTAKGHFTSEQQQRAIALRKKLTGADPSAPFTPKLPNVPTGKAAAFKSPTAEKAYHAAMGGGGVAYTTKFEAYDGPTKDEFDSLAIPVQKAIISDLQNLANYHWSNNLEPSQKDKVKLDIFPKLTGKPFGAPFTPKTKAKIKFSSPVQENAYEHSLKIGDGDPLPRFEAYQDLSKEEFEALPSAAQKNIAADLYYMATAGPYSTGEYHALFGLTPDRKDIARQKLIGLVGGVFSPKQFKPKTKAQKEYEKLGDAYFQPATDDSGNVISTGAEMFEKKVSIAKKSTAALSAAPLSYTNHSDWSFKTPNYTGYDVRQAVENYRGSGYDDINGGLRATKGKLSAWASYNTYSLERVKQLDEGMDQSPLTDPVVTLRGFKTPEKVFGASIWNNGKTDLTGMEWIEHGFSSTTTNSGVAESFAGVSSSGDPYKRVILRIFTPKGIKGIKLSGPEYEYELLLERGVKFRVVADHGIQDNARRLDVEVIGVSK